MSVPDNLRYTEEHEWVSLVDGFVMVGITDFAQEQLGEIVFVETPAEGESFGKGDVLGAVESTKAVSDFFCPVAGKVVEVNEALIDSPDTINNSPYADGWLVKIAPDDLSCFEDLMDADAYGRFLETAS